MTKLAIKSPNTAQNKHDRSFNAQPLALPLQPTGEKPAWLHAPPAAPAHTVEVNWLDGVTDPAVFDGLNRPSWQMAASALKTLLATWRTRALMRRDLAQIDARSLREAGIDPGVAGFEAAQPFWRKPMVLRDLPTDRD